MQTRLVSATPIAALLAITALGSAQAAPARALTETRTGAVTQVQYYGEHDHHGEHDRHHQEYHHHYHHHSYHHHDYDHRY